MTVNATYKELKSKAAEAADRVGNHQMKLDKETSELLAKGNELAGAAADPTVGEALYPGCEATRVSSGLEDLDLKLDDLTLSSTVDAAAVTAGRVFFASRRARY